MRPDNVIYNARSPLDIEEGMPACMSKRTVFGATHFGHSVTSHVQKGFKTCFDSNDLVNQVSPSLREKRGKISYLSTPLYAYFRRFARASSGMYPMVRSNLGRV